MKNDTSPELSISIFKQKHLFFVLNFSLKTDILCDGEKVYNKIFDAAKHVAFMVEGKTFTLTIEGGK